MNIDRLREELKIDEGVKYEIYLDHLGLPTFGIGHLVLPSDPEHGKPVGTPISEDRVNECFASDTDSVLKDCKLLFLSFEVLPSRSDHRVFQSVEHHLRVNTLLFTKLLNCLTKRIHH